LKIYKFRLHIPALYDMESEEPSKAQLYFSPPLQTGSIEL
jgi:hypothetical protein